MEGIIEPPVKRGSPRTFTRFLSNLIRQGTITMPMAETLAKLKTPHLQLEALMRLHATPEKGLETIVAELRELSFSQDTGNERRAVSPLSLSITSRHFLLLVSAFVLFAAVLFGPRSRVTPLSPPSESSVIPLASPTPAAPAQIVPDAVVSVPKPALPEPPRHLSATNLPSGMVHLMWDEAQPNAIYRIYGSEAEDMSDAKIEQPDRIPMNWLDWIPPADAGPMWLAVSRITPDGKESPRSKPVLISPAPRGTSSLTPQQ